MVHGEQISLSTKGFSDIHDLTARVEQIVAKSGIKNGLVCVLAVGSTASVSTIEYEPALSEDFRDQLEKLAPHTMRTRHSETWGDDNGNISADAVRDACLQALSEVLDESLDTIIAMVDQRIQQKQ